MSLNLGDSLELPAFEEPASSKFEVRSGEMIEMELLIFSVRIAVAVTGSWLLPRVKEALVPVLTRRTHYRADAEKLLELANFQFWLRALPIQLAAILYMFGTGATVMGLCKLFGERRIAQLFGVAKPEKKQARLDFTELNSILSLFRLVNWMF